MKKEYIFVGIILVVIAIMGIFLLNNNKKEQSIINNAEDMKKMINTIYKDVELPSLETITIDINNKDEVSLYTGLKTNTDVEELVVSVPLMNAQAYSLAVVKLKENSDIEKMKNEMLENINMSRWVCVTAEKLYITNNGNVIFLVMASEDWAKPVYEGFKKYVNNNIGKELEKTADNTAIELPPEMKVN